MTTTVDGLGAAVSAPPQPVRRIAVGAAVLVTAAVAANTGVGLTAGAPRLLVVLPLVGMAGIMLAGLAVSRFEAFVLAALLARASLDALKVNDSGIGAAMNPASALALLFLVAAVSWAARRRWLGLCHAGSGLQTAASLYLVAAALSVAGSDDLMTSGLELLRIAAAVGMFFVLDRLLDSESSVRRLLLVLFMSAVVPLTMTLAGMGSSSSVRVGNDLSRTASTFSHPNPFAHYLLILVLMGVALLPHLSPRWRVALGAFVVWMGTALMLTYTRGAWVGLFVGLLVIGLLQSRVILVALALAVVVLPVAVPSVAARVSELRADDVATANREDSLEWRLQYWKNVAPLANENPVTGIGLKMTSYRTEQSKQPHNDYLRAYVEMGVVGLVAFVNLVAALLIASWRALRRHVDGLARGVSVGFFSYAVAFALVSSAENLNSQVVVLWYLFASAAMASWALRRPPGTRAASSAPSTGPPLAAEEGP